MKSGSGAKSVFVIKSIGEMPSWKAHTKNRSISPRRGSGLVVAATITK